MRIAILAPVSSIHVQRWIEGLSRVNLYLILISQHDLSSWKLPRNVKFYRLRYSGLLGYFLNFHEVRVILRKENIDLLNAHYASGYGTTSNLVNFRPSMLSVWGSDVYDFPFKSRLHRLGVTANLKSADLVASTSHCMSTQTRILAPMLDEIAITPFGVDCNHFSPPPLEPWRRISEDSTLPITIGTVKSLSHVYGVDVLITAFSLARCKIANVQSQLANRLRLCIVGNGPDAEMLKSLVNQLQLTKVVDFVGSVPHAQVPMYLRRMDIFVALSRAESFGVAAIEAGAVGLPVVVSDAGGLPEVVLQGKTGLVVPKDDPQAACDALIQLICNPELRQQLGIAGRKHVLANYSWDASLKTMVSVYERLIATHKSKMQIEK